MRYYLKGVVRFDFGYETVQFLTVNGDINDARKKAIKMNSDMRMKYRKTHTYVSIYESPVTKSKKVTEKYKGDVTREKSRWVYITTGSLNHYHIRNDGTTIGIVNWK